MGQIGCPKTSVKDYHTTQRNIPEERRCRGSREFENMVPTRMIGPKTEEVTGELLNE
jgi:hypothetical protein